MLCCLFWLVSSKCLGSKSRQQVLTSCECHCSRIHVDGQICNIQHLCLYLSLRRRLSSRRIGCEAGNDKKQGCESSNDKKNLVVVCVQTASTCKMAAMVVACIEHKPEGLGAGDECQVVSDVVQNGLRTQRHCKEMRTKMKHPFIGAIALESLYQIGVT